MADYKKGPFGSALKKDIFVPKSDNSVKVYEQQNAINKNWKLERYFITKEYATELKAFETHSGDILVSCAGTIGEMYELPSESEDGVINQALMRVRVNDKVVSKKLYQLLFSNMINDFSREHSNGSAMKNIPPFADLKSMNVVIPSLEEQVLIEECFQHFDNLITLHQRKLDKLINVKKSMLEKMFPKQGSTVPEIRFNGFTQAWEQRKFSELVQIERGGSPRPIDDFITNAPNGLNWIKIGDAPTQGHFITKTAEKIRPEGLSKTREVHPGDLILSNSMSFGKPYIMGIDGCIHDGWLLIRNTYEVFDLTFLCHLLGTPQMLNQYRSLAAGSTVNNLNKELVGNTVVTIPNIVEQRVLGDYLEQIDNLITLHQCEPKNKMEDNKMLDNINNQILFCDYYEKWIKVYKEGAIRKVTLEKYYMTHRWLKKLIPELKICEMTRINYQQLLNDYALYHERQTTMDFHHQLKGAILDAVDEGLLDRDPTRKAIIKGKTPAAKKIKYINQFELHTLLNNLNLKSEISWDWFILIIAKTGLRFSEALALTPKDFDFGRQSISVSKTWDYKGDGGFLPTKNKSSVRKVQIDWQTVIQFSELIKGLPEDKPIFVNGKVYNSTVNDILARYCKKANVPVISVHGLRHTHASLLLFAGVSIASVARRLGHSSMNTTQKTYLHIIQELESQDVDLVMRSLSGLS